MKLTVKTLQKTTFKVDIEPDKTVKDLKDVIEQEQGKDHPSASQKLIYNGKILADESKLSEYEFDEKKFIVLMITRPPPVPKPASTSTDSAPSTNKQKTEEKSKPAARPAPATPTATTVSQSTSSTTSSTTTATATTASTRAQPRDETNQQLAASRNSSLGDLSALSMGEPQLAARLANLMTQPHFRQMQDLIQQSPHLLSSTIEALAASDPEMYTFIQENPDVFVSALNHPPLAGMRTGNPAGARQPPAARGGSQQAVGVQGGGGAQPVMDQLLGGVSEHDKAAIERLKELGFSEYLAVQAYMACDKDEQLAANLLFQMDQ